MAKAMAVSGEDRKSTQPVKKDESGQVAGFYERSVGFLRDVRTELTKVTTPSRQEVRTTTIVVIVTVFVFAAYFWLIDAVIGRMMTSVLHWLGGAQ